ncbi:hypothetical protein GY45DRAFT_453564 [Cubamyces sp. BRFM 1775]|nr:hypothetical protein GY45DRAFT_453564 [Cubamyces sp. BRFM 1775]
MWLICPACPSPDAPPSYTRYSVRDPQWSTPPVCQCPRGSTFKAGSAARTPSGSHPKSYCDGSRVSGLTHGWTSHDPLPALHEALGIPIIRNRRHRRRRSRRPADPQSVGDGPLPCHARGRGLRPASGHVRSLRMQAVRCPRVVGFLKSFDPTRHGLAALGAFDQGDGWAAHREQRRGLNSRRATSTSRREGASLL